MPVQKVFARNALCAMFALLWLMAMPAFGQETPDLFEEAGSTSTEAKSTEGVNPEGADAEETGTGEASSKSQKADAEAPAIKMQLSFVDDVAVGQDLQVRGRISDNSIGTQEIREKIQLLGTISTGQAVDGLVPSAITWSQLVRVDNEGSALLTKKLESRFRIPESNPNANADEAVYAEGDIDSMVETANRLLADGATVKDEAPKEAAAAAGGGEPDFKTSGSGTPENSAFDNLSIPKTEAADPVEEADTVTLSTAGCEIEVNLDAGIAQVTSQEVVNGNPSGNCSPNGTSYPLIKSYASCPDITDFEAKKAWAAFKRTYVDGGGTTHPVDEECQKDPEFEFTMVQDDSVCTFQLDFLSTPPMARNRGKWVYPNKNNNRVEVSGCEVIEDQATEIISTTKNCIPRHDFDANVSHEQARQYYMWESVERVVTECNDTGTTMTHIVYDNKCSDLTPTQADLVNWESGDAALIAVPQERIAIEIDGKEVWITECQPIEDSSAELVKDTQGCESTFYHYQSAGQSFGSAKWKYQIEGKPEITLTACVQDNDVEYPHQVRIADYEDHDTQLFSYPMTEIYIDTPVGEELVSGAQVRDGAPEIPYTFQQNLLLATGELFFEGEESCEQFMRRNEIDRYLTGDGVNVYDHILGEGEALSQGDGCDPKITWELNPRFSRSHGYITSITSAQWENGKRDRDIGCRSHRIVDAEYKLVRSADGIVIHSETQTASTYSQTVANDQGFYGGERNHFYCTRVGYPGYPSSIPGSTRANYEANWGW